MKQLVKFLILTVFAVLLVSVIAFTAHFVFGYISDAEEIIPENGKSNSKDVKIKVSGLRVP